MRMTIFAAIAAMSLGLAPAMTGEGNGEPFPNNAGSLTTQTALTAPQVADTGSAAHPNFAGRPGSNLPRLAGDVLPASGSEGAVQTANFLPAHFEEGTVAYVQANRVQSWMLAHAQRRTPVFAAVSPMRTHGGWHTLALGGPPIRPGLSHQSVCRAERPVGRDMLLHPA